jgi:hypothetical protein
VDEEVMTVNALGTFPRPPEDFRSFKEVAYYLKNLWEAMQNVRRGKTENVIEVTLTADAGTTTISDPRLSRQSVLVFDPKTANAAAELAAGTLYASTRGKGEWILTHANNSQTDRSFQSAIIG